MNENNLIESKVSVCNLTNVVTKNNIGNLVTIALFKLAVTTKNVNVKTIIFVKKIQQRLYLGLLHPFTWSPTHNMGYLNTGSTSIWASLTDIRSWVNTSLLLFIHKVSDCSSYMSLLTDVMLLQCSCVVFTQIVHDRHCRQSGFTQAISQRNRSAFDGNTFAL